MTTDNHPATTRQVGGEHYLTNGIQPVELWQRNRWDGCACSILKYLARYKRKNGLEDLQKACHFVELRQKFERHLQPPPAPVITMAAFTASNGITDPLDVDALDTLESYVYASPMFRDAQAEMLIGAIDRLMLRSI